MSNTTTTKTQKPAGDRMSIVSLLVILVITNVWFFSQAMNYVH